jgi:hypothetical protein
MKAESISSLKLALRNPIAYHRVLASVGGGATVGLFLSQCWYWTIKTRNDEDGWWSKTQAEWENETGLKRREQERARRQLKVHGILEERKTGVPAKLYFRLNLDTLARLIEQSPKPTSQDVENAIPGWHIPAHKDVRVQRSRMTE